MPLVRNTTGVPVIYGNAPVVCGGTIEVSDSEAIQLVQAGWSIVAQEVAPVEVEEPLAPVTPDDNEKEEV